MRQVILPAYGGARGVDDGRRARAPGRGRCELLVRVRAAGGQPGRLPPARGRLSHAARPRQRPGSGDCRGGRCDGRRTSSRSGSATGVFGLVAEGGYAEYAVLHAGLSVPIPEDLELRGRGAAVIEVFCTANETVFELGGLREGRSILVHAGGERGRNGGGGRWRSRPAPPSTSRPARAARSTGVLDLGADHGILYKTEDFVEEVLRITRGEGVDVVEDFIGADYLARNLAVLKPAGTLLLVGLMGGQTAPFDLGGNAAQAPLHPRVHPPRPVHRRQAGDRRGASASAGSRSSRPDDPARHPRHGCLSRRCAAPTR